MTKLAHIADRVLNRPLMIHPDKLAVIASVLDGRIGIEGPSLDVEAEFMKQAPDASRFVGQFELNDPSNPAAGRKPYRTTAAGVAVIPVMGSLVNRGAWVGAFSGISSYEGFKFAIGQAAADNKVRSIILDMDSPGGEAVGAFEAGDAVRAAAEAKEVVAVVNGMAASAAYAIAAQASRIVTTSSGISGSIGVVMLHADYSKALHDRGVVPTLIFAGARKVDGNPYEKLSAEVKGELKAEIDRFYDLFVASVSKGRNALTEKAIRATEARTYIGADAVKVGLADAVGSFEGILSELSAKSPRRSTQNNARNFMQTATDATKLERDRIKAITSLSEAVGREGLALTLATTTDLSVDQVKAILITSTMTTVGGRAGDSQSGVSLDPVRGGGNSGADLSALWDRVFAAKRMSAECSDPHVDGDKAPGSWDRVLQDRGLTAGGR